MKIFWHLNGVKLPSNNKKEHIVIVLFYLLDFILTEEQRKDMSLEEQLKDLNEKLEMTQAIKSGSKSDWLIG